MQVRSISSRQHARGAALLIIFAILGITAIFFLVGQLSTVTAQYQRQRITAQALAQAREALIGYAITYPEKHAGQTFGYLPLPDTGGLTTSFHREGDAAGVAGGKDLAVIGRLPWRTLGLPPLRDEYGECLWYAVSGTFKNNPNTDYMNWDTLGQFDIYSSNGTSAGTRSTTGSDPYQRPAAIVFSAGPPLNGQNRQNSTTDAVDECGGNYDVRNYLDPYTPTASLNNITNYFAGSTNNAIATSTTGPKIIVAAPVQVGGQIVVNDRMVTITPQAIFDAIQQRSDFETRLQMLISDVTSCMQSSPQTPIAPVDSALVFGRLPMKSNLIVAGVCSSITSDPTRSNMWNNWQDQFRYLRCGTSGCVNVNVTNGVSGPMQGVVLFGGKRSSSQAHSSTTATTGQYNDPLYLDIPNSSQWVNSNLSTNYTGAANYSKAAPTQDIAIPIP